jgi:hypothetical protein
MVTVPLIRSTVVTVPVSGACWASVTELMTASMETAKTVFTSLIYISRILVQSGISRAACILFPGAIENAGFPGDLPARPARHRQGGR